MLLEESERALARELRALRVVGPALVAIEAVAGRVDVGAHFRVRGFESAGKYVEYVDMKTGKTLGHRVFK